MFSQLIDGYGVVWGSDFSRRIWRGGHTLSLGTPGLVGETGGPTRKDAKALWWDRVPECAQIGTNSGLEGPRGPEMLVWAPEGLVRAGFQTGQRRLLWASSLQWV